MVVSALLPTPIKLFRVAPFALGIPALVTLFLVTIAKEAGSRVGRAGAVVGAVVLAGGLFWASGSSVSSFDEAAAASITERLTQARTAGRYLDGVSRAGRPVIFVTEGNPRLLDRVVRSAVPPDLIADTWVFVGRPSDLATAGPIDDPSRPRLTEVAQKWWAAAWPDPSQVFARDPLVIRIGPAGRTEGASEEGALELAPGVEVVHGPPPAASFAPPAPYRATWTELLVATGLALVVLIMVGGGWTLSMLEVSRLATFGLAPAFGIATLILGGTVASRLGLSLARPGGSLIVLAIGGVGWLVFALARTASADRTSAGAQGSPVG